MATKTRDSNIELLRILTICGVVVLHYNGNVAFAHVAAGSVNQYVLLVLEALFICAVNLFILISGYFLSGTTQRKSVKVLELLVQVVLIGVGKYFVNCLIEGKALSIVSLIGWAIPNNYFVTLYLTLYIASPYINLALNKLSQKRFTILLGLVVLLFSIWPTVLDVFWEATGMHFNGMYPMSSGGSQYGYSLLNFVMMYLIGAYFRRFNVGKQCKGIVLLLGMVACVGVLVIWQLRFAQSARSYANPLVIAVGSMVFLLFRRLSIRSQLINTVAKGAFTCFLVHDAFLLHIGIEKVVNQSLLVLLGHMIASVVLIYGISWIVWRIYTYITGPVFRWMGTKLGWADRLLSPEE